jgi:ATP-dependent helicase HrpB
MIPLPIDSVLPEIVRAVTESRAVVLAAPPGAGKTTRVPPAILAANLLDPKHPNLVMLQPRRVAARAAATRIAEENNWTLGREVGYQVRFERVMGRDTRLRVVTEGILTRQLLDDPFLDGVGAVVLDEFHERSIHTDLAISMLREVRESVRGDLILIVMSATLAAEPVAEFLGGCPIIRSPGRLFDVKTEHRPPSGAEIEDRVAEEVRKMLALPPEESGDVLVFLPGAREINQTQRLLANAADLVLPLYGALPFEQQVRALKPAQRRKVILATNIAETSLTIPGVKTVIDSGLERQAFYEARRGMDQLRLKRISRASAQQRAGRAGRTGPGRCVRLWTIKEDAELEEFEKPEIQRVDLAGTLLALHSWGKTDPLKFGWFEPPAQASLLAADRLLQMLGALKDGRLTPIGRRMLALPVHPRLARLLIAAADAGLAARGALLAARLSEGEINIPSGMGGSSDLLVGLDRIDDRQVQRLKEDLQRLVGRADRAADESELLKLVLLAYPDRVVRRRKNDPQSAVMVGGAGLRMSRESVVRTQEFFVAVEARQDDRSAKGEAMVFVASAIEPAWLEECFPGSVVRRQIAEFDEKRQKVVGRTQTCYLDLVLSEESDAAVHAEMAGKVLAEALRPRAAEILAANDAAAKLAARVEFLHKWMPEHPWPKFDVGELIDEACGGKRSVEEVQRGLASTLRQRLEYPLDRLLDEQAPEALTVPSGKRIGLRYEMGRPPVLAARLQELFGWTSTPRLAGGRAAVVLEILGPNYRPVQVTDDLASFWKNTYQQVRKDLRRRYPKHSWPENPMAMDRKSDAHR